MTISKLAKLPIFLTATFGLIMSAGQASGQDIDRAIQAYNDDNHEEAAFLFYDVIENSSDPDSRVKSEYYIAQSLYKAGYKAAALQYYGDVFNAGKAHPYFLKATEGLMRVAIDMGDDTLVPALINRGYSEDFAKLKPSVLNTINYMIGMVTHRRANYAEARDFLLAVSDKSALYVKARYLLAIMSVKTAAEQQAEDYSEAIGYFTEIEKLLKGQNAEEDKKLYRLALLGKARAYYSQGDWQKSREYYESVPRFSDDWYDSMFESGWAYFQNAEFGKALGMVHSIQSPYFDDRYRAESWVLKATTYFQLCHFDRARKALEWFIKMYEPMANQLNPVLQGELTDYEMVEMIEKGSKDFPNEIRNQINSNRRYKKFRQVVISVEDELKRATKTFPEGAFKAYLLELLKDQQSQWVQLTGNLVREQVRRESLFLEDFLNQARIIKFETADAERKMLEAGKDITKGPRARGPRPFVPNARFQYWAFLGEYWIDELGFYEHSIKNECIPEVFE